MDDVQESPVQTDLAVLPLISTHLPAGSTKEKYAGPVETVVILSALLEDQEEVVCAEITELPVTDIPELQKVLRDHRQVFGPLRNDADNPMVCKIELQQQHLSTSLSARGFPMSAADEKELKKQVAAQVAAGLVEEVPGTSHPQIVSPAFLVPKADGSKRLVVDYAKLNKLIKPTGLPLPVMDPLIERLAASRYLSKMDLTSGFHQVRLTADSRDLTAFVLPDGSMFRYLVLPMGLCTSPGIFQSYTARHVRAFKQLPENASLIARGATLDVLMDDFLIGTLSLADHISFLTGWLRYAERSGLRFKPSKCELAVPEITVLGRRVRYKEWGPVLTKTLPIVDRRPASVTELRGVLGATNWIRRHVKDMSSTWTLSNLLRKGVPWRWEPEHEEAWQRLRTEVINATPARAPETGAPILMVTDSSDEGGGGVLLQEQMDEISNERRTYVLGHWSWKWTGARTRYAAFEKELMAGILLLAAQQDLLRAAPLVVWITDAAAVPPFLAAAPPLTNARRIRWWWFAHQFPLSCLHCAGTKNELADALSRGSTYADAGLDLDKAAKQAFASMDEALDLVLVPSAGELAGTFEESAQNQPVVQALSEGEEALVDGVLWRRHGDVLYRETRPVIPPSFLRPFLTSLHHKLGHVGPARLLAYANPRFYFLSGVEAKQVADDIHAACQVCIRTKPSRPRDRGREGVLPIPEMVGAEVAIDLIHLPDAGPGDPEKALFILDTLSGYVQVVPCSSGISSSGVVKALWESWIRHYGAPARITADNDVRWRASSGVWTELLEEFGVELHLTTPYASGANGRCERAVQEFRKVLRAISLQVPRLSEAERVVLATCIKNAQPREPEGMSPAELFQHGRAQWHENLSPSLSPTSDLGVGIAKATKAVRDIMVTQRQRRHDRQERVRPPSQVCPGTWVYVHHSRLPSLTSSSIPWVGPYLVEAVHGREATLIAGRQRLRVHFSHLKIAYPASFSPSTDDLQGGDPSADRPGTMTAAEMANHGWFATDQVLSHRRRGRGYQFHVKWSDGSTTWVPVPDLLIPRLDGSLRPSQDLADYLAAAGDAELSAEIDRRCTTPPFSTPAPLSSPMPPSALPNSQEPPPSLAPPSATGGLQGRRLRVSSVEAAMARQRRHEERAARRSPPAEVSGLATSAPRDNDA